MEQLHQKLTVILNKHNISPNLLYFLLCCRGKTFPIKSIDEFEERKKALLYDYINLSGNITSKGKHILNDFDKLFKSKPKKTDEEILGNNFQENIKIYREMFPPNRMEKVGLLRQSEQELKSKFLWFFKTYPQFDWETILDATDYYIYNKEKENYEFITTSSYFIQRTDIHSKISRSLLADYCQLILDNKKK